MHTCFLTANPAPLPNPANGFAFLPPGRKDRGRNETSSALISNVSWPKTVGAYGTLFPFAAGTGSSMEIENLRHTNPLPAKCFLSSTRQAMYSLPWHA